MKRTWMIWVLALLLLASCTAATKSRGQKASRDYDHEYNLVYSAVKTVLLGRGYQIIKDEQEKGVLETGWTEGKRTRTQALVSIMPMGRALTKVQVEVLIDKKGLTSEEWKPSDVEVAVYDDLLEDIDTQAYREYFLRIERPTPTRK